ncbi:carbon-nitrogen hydrolase family protein [Chitinophaga pinensis]|uniref:Nitrilase/cyanide hydratase and apolipoprotein N-acyltransferase n=1 Tax=Chitinophaga pinensis (strain ATCC 43595 / DSM 2588 / LMG 13176 / NBRC 15968 / NCIMB 11800 / UQM 2034) TaxID=485918 RepID=A0A979GAY7_CHIPD|nr:carbon-nitrogen hydrolase family protein [Chitinophaga pinensis]ACU63880.1 Nitrilase/cyanide hydratase and apolipoprotein N- acyltransferase [Chitinophaga pinensis DSM 2588]
MKLCVAQARAVKGDILTNIENHKKIIDLAVSNGADTIIFPELSITGYEPTLAKELATELHDERLNVFQDISDEKAITIGVGVPLKTAAGITISMVLFQPQESRHVYAKKYLHADEDPYFVSGESSLSLLGEDGDVALAICYELSVPQHVEDAYKCGAQFYLASSVKSTGGIENAFDRLSRIGCEYDMMVLLSNAVGESDGFQCAGKSAVWDSTGAVLEQLDATNEGILILDTDTRTAMSVVI